MKIKNIILKVLLSIMVFIPLNVKAVSGSIKVDAPSNVVVGNSITVKITLSSSAVLGAWEFDINYDNSYLTLVSSSAEFGGDHFSNAGDGKIKSKTYTLKFQAKKNGSTNITVGSTDVVDWNYNDISISKTNKKIRIMTEQELQDSYSKDNNLKSLVVKAEEQEYVLDKEFDKDTLDYSVTLPTGITKVNIEATKNDNTATVDGAGEVEVTEGANLINIVVTAQNGDSKTYTLTVNVEDQNPIEVKVDKDTYVVVKNATLLNSPATFSETTVKINDFDIPAFYNNVADITLVGLKNPKGEIELFMYDDGNYTKYQEIDLKSLLLIPTKLTEELNYEKVSVNINDAKVEAYKISDDYVIISAKSLETGKTNLYLYGLKEKTALKYEDELFGKQKETIKNYSYIIISFAVISLIMLIIIFSLIHSLHKKQKKMDKFLQKQEAKLEATRKLNNVVEEVKKIKEQETKKERKEEKKKEVVKKEEEQVKVQEVDNKVSEETEEIYNIFEDDRKMRNKVKKRNK